MTGQKESKVKTKNQSIVDIALEIQGKDAIEAGQMNFVSLNFVQTILPHSKIEEKTYLRENGAYSLFISSSESIPYGTIPRMILSWIVTEAIRTNSKEITIGNNLSQFMKNIGLPTDGRTMKRFKEQSLALFGSMINIKYDDGQTVSAKNVLIATDYEFWWADGDQRQLNLFSSKIKLSDEFFDLIKKYHVPVDLRALTALKQSSLAVDVYSWLTYRFYSLKGRTFISWEALQFQFGSGYQNNASGKQGFKKNFQTALEKIAILYPEAHFEVAHKGILLYPSPTHITKIAKNKDLLLGENL